MCNDNDHDSTPLPSSVTRRGVIGAAIALAGAGLASIGGPAQAVAAATANPSRPRPFGRPPLPAPLVIENGTMLDPLTGRVTEDAVVVLDRGKVVAAGDRNRTRGAVADVAGRARTIDVAGRWILPGLIDAHVHENAVADGRAALDRGATTVRSGSSNFYQDIGIRALAPWAPGVVPRMKAAGTFVTPNLGDTILGDPALAPLAAETGGVRSPQALRYLTRVNLDRGVDFIKTRVNERAGLPDQDPRVQVYGFEQVSAIVAEARKRGAGVMCHSYSEKAIDDAVRAGITSLEHGVFVSEQTLHRMRAQGTFFTPTMSAIAGLKDSADPILKQRGEEFFPILQQAVRHAFELGVPVVAGTDSFGLDVDPIGGEVRHVHEAGLPTLDAIRTATTGAAQLLGLDGVVGRLAAGFAADVIAVDGSPLDDIGALERIRLVVSGGAVATEALG